MTGAGRVHAPDGGRPCHHAMSIDTTWPMRRVALEPGTLAPAGPVPCLNGRPGGGVRDPAASGHDRPGPSGLARACTLAGSEERPGGPGGRVVRRDRGRTGLRDRHRYGWTANGIERPVSNLIGRGPPGRSRRGRAPSRSYEEVRACTSPIGWGATQSRMDLDGREATQAQKTIMGREATQGRDNSVRPSGRERAATRLVVPRALRDPGGMDPSWARRGGLDGPGAGWPPRAGLDRPARAERAAVDPDRTGRGPIGRSCSRSSRAMELFINNTPSGPPSL